MGLRHSVVLVVDDDKRFRSLLTTTLESAGFEAIPARDGDRAIAAARERRPDAVILDVVLPGLGGFELCRELRATHGDDLPVLFVSGERTDPHDRATGIMLGGDDYLVKPPDLDELVARVRRLIDRSRRSAGTVVDLTGREIEVLQLVAEGWPPTEIAEQLSISRKTVSSHMQRIFTKLGVHTRAQAVAVAYEAGLIRVVPNTTNGDVVAHMADAVDVVDVA
jgi:DNA-binding NarL/FixJ family response regulator